MIEARALSKHFGDFTAVKKVSFSVQAGQKLILLGTSGSGKTTTLKMINRLIEPSSGQLLINGKDVLKQNPEDLRKEIGYVIQNTGLFPHYTVAQNIAIVPNLLGWEKNKTQSRTLELMEMLDLPAKDLLNRYPQELSGGQKQRVGIARALATNPPLMLLDEPFGALDPITRSQIHVEFKRIESLVNKTMVMVTHDVFEAVELGTFICLMDKGEIQQLGTPKDLVFNPKNEFVANFFQAQRFQLELKVLKLQDIFPLLPPPEKPNASAFYLDFPLETDLLTVMEKSAQSLDQEPVLRIFEGAQKILSTTKRQDILAAFYRAKQAGNF